jgi:TIR domain
VATNEPKRKLWLTYAWVDNEQADIDFIVHQLTAAGIEVHIDREQLIAGHRLWNQIGQHIEDPKHSDAWAFALSKHSLESEACQEELAIALDRALRSRGDAFPLIGIFLEPIDPALVPPAIRTRLYVALDDKDWARRVAAGVYGQPAPINRPSVAPFECTKHSCASEIVIELRPRAGRWYPCVAAISKEERDLFSAAFVAPRGVPPPNRLSFGSMTGENGQLYFRTVGQEANPSTSLFLVFSREPSFLIAGSQKENYVIWGTPPRA